MKRHLLALALGFLALAPDAFAVVGRPLTPVSYAGVARRTTRRTVYAASAATAATTAAVTALPPGCVQVVQAGYAYYNCGAARYAPAYQGGAVVYVPAP